VNAYAHRVQSVKGVCRARNCSRRVELDPKILCTEGLGLLSMRQVETFWLCHKIGGCRLEFHREKALNPLVLGQFVGRPNVRVRLRCRSERCKFHRVWRVEEMIAGLEKRGQGGARTEVDQLAAKMTSACPARKRVNWIAEILWINTDTMGWRVKGERSFDSADQG
jgi:hypothetical protein